MGQKKPEQQQPKNGQKKPEIQIEQCPMRHLPKIFLKFILPIIIAYFIFQEQIHHFYDKYTGEQSISGNQNANNGEIPVDKEPENIHTNYKISYRTQTLINKVKHLHPLIGSHTRSVKSVTDPDFYFDPSATDEISLQKKQNLQEVVNFLHLWSDTPFEKHHYDTRYDFNRGRTGVINDYDYCKKSDMIKLQKPDTVLKNYYFYIDFEKNHVLRDITRSIGVDLTPFATNENDTSRTYNLDLRISNINSKRSRVHHFHPFHKCLFCLFQTSNHIPGKWDMTGKDLVINNYVRYQNRNFQNPEECRKSMTFMPESYRLYNKEECTSFFDFLRSEEYTQLIKEQGIAFIMKAGRDVHRGEGITIMTPDVKEEYVRKYRDGQSCGVNKDIMQVQRYIANPMTYKGNKIEVRIYFLIASADPLIVYAQENAHLRMCSEPFDKYSLKKESHVCNVSLAAQGGNTGFVIDFSLPGLRDYLLEEGVISNPNWVEEEIYPQIHRAVTHLTRTGKYRLLKDSRFNENFALDFLIDDKSRIWFLENNPNPQIMRTSEKRVERHYKMFADQYEIQFNYLRARFSRIQGLAKRMIKDLEDVRQNQEKWRAEFEKLNQNAIHTPEFEISQGNSYKKVYDESLQGADKFMGFLPPACEIIRKQKPT